LVTSLWRTFFSLLLAAALAACALPLVVSAQTADDAEPAAPAAVESDSAAPASAFAIGDDAIQSYYTLRGGSDTFGEPISREFLLLGKPSQLFQRALLQVQPDGTVLPANLMGSNLLPYTHFNGLTVPATDRALAAVTPNPSQPQYGARLLEFVRATVPDTWQGQSVGFQSAVFSTVSCGVAFPHGGCTPDLLALIGLEVWGAPTSAPAADPRNPSFIYQRFERGVLFYDATIGTTTWLPMGEMLKAVLTGQNLPPDLATDASASPLLRQYDSAQPNSVARPAALADSDLTDAFTPDV
jgi:hypothetical protein